MAKSAAHRLGQYIGIMLEQAMRPKLESIIGPDYFLDSVSTNRLARGNKKKVSWCDAQGNTHDLDFVIEKGGTYETIGHPKAFIECAWRRYTKHSKNKVQEIQGAIQPLALTYISENPFLGAILAGEFTSNSMSQLKSHGFKVLFIPYFQIVKAYEKIGIDISFHEDTGDIELTAKANALAQLNTNQINTVISNLYSLIDSDLNDFLDELAKSLDRKVTNIIIQPLYGSSCNFTDIASAQSYLNRIDLSILPSNLTLNKIFIYVEYSNGDNFKGEVQNVLDGLNFLSKC